MRNSLDRLLGDVTLVTLALAIALGWSLFQVAAGLSAFVSTLLIETDAGLILRATRLGEPLTWEVKGRVFMLGPLLRALIEVAVVLLVALWIRSRRTVAADPS
jgi:hypothetical protein